MDFYVIYELGCGKGLPLVEGHRSCLQLLSWLTTEIGVLLCDFIAYPPQAEIMRRHVHDL